MTVPAIIAYYNSAFFDYKKIKPQGNCRLLKQEKNCFRNLAMTNTPKRHGHKKTVYAERVDITPYPAVYL
jgi:hypothetical protein